MAYYAIGIKSLMDRLEETDIIQEWFTDDAACLGELLHIKKWWDRNNDLGPKYGYFPNASKCWLICKTEEIANKARRILENTGLNITHTAQKSHMRSVIGELNSCRKFAEEKIETWTKSESPFKSSNPSLISTTQYTHEFSRID